MLLKILIIIQDILKDKYSDLYIMSLYCILMQSDDDGFPFADINPTFSMRNHFSSNFQQDSPQPIIQQESKFILQGNSNNKNKYIKKINEMIQQTSRDHISQTIRFTPDKRPKVEVQINNLAADEVYSDKLAKSRLSAKMSRQRKKLYIDLLETKVVNLEKQVQKSKEQLETTKGFLDKLVKQNQTISGFTASKHQTMRKLQSIIQKDSQTDIDEINCILDSLRYRIGANGRERVNTLNEYFRQIINISFPALHRYMMWIASEQKHLFNEEFSDDEIWFKQFFENLGLSQPQKRQILSKRNQFSEQKHILLSLIDDLNNTKKMIEVKSADLEDQVDVIRKILNPMQCAKFIIFIQRNKYRKQLNIWEKGLPSTKNQIIQRPEKIFQN